MLPWVETLQETGRVASGNAQSDYYRQKAEEAVKHSEACVDPAMRLSWLELAERWVNLVDLGPAESNVTTKRALPHRRDSTAVCLKANRV